MLVVTAVSAMGGAEFQFYESNIDLSCAGELILERVVVAPMAYLLVVHLISYFARFRVQHQ